MRRSDSAPDLPRAGSFSRLLGSTMTRALFNPTIGVEPPLHVWSHENAPLNPKQDEDDRAEGQPQPNTGPLRPCKREHDEANDNEPEAREPD